MQDKSLDAMAKKYKEEMMRLYANGASANKAAVPNEPSAAAEVTVKPCDETVNGTSQQQCAPCQTRDTERLMHPPMPQIPKVVQKSERKVVENAQANKFPSPDEILAAELPQNTQDTPQSEGMPRFDSGHEQGNYDFTEAQSEQGTNENIFSDGEGYLKLEVSGGGLPVDCALAAVFRVNEVGDVLTATFFTDAKGETEVITLPVLGLDEKYTVTVAKEGFFTVHDLEIPIFDSIKSIQPVELKQEKQ